jgi:Domain of unknown function (DUF4340)
VTEPRKTWAAIGLAVAVSFLAWATAPRTSTPDAFQERGTSFFPGFNDPRMVQSIEVVDFDEETATAHPFKVQVQNGLWTIPSEYDYAVDGTERLAKTVSAIIALKKDNVATENVSEREGTGTLDPLDETLPTLHGRGKRVTIKGDNDRVLADVIIGNALAGRPQFRYVRLADQARVYVAEVGDLDISSKFTDWIDRDLLHIEWNDLDQAIIQDYSLDKVTHGINVRDTLFLQKLGEDRDRVVHWTMRDLQPGEQVDTFRANLFNTTLSELSIIGVRPKPPAIVAGAAQLSGTLKVSQSDLSELGSKGFYFTAKGELVSDEGAILVHTKSGLFFRLLFGDIAPGDPGDITPRTAQTDSTLPTAAGSMTAPAAAIKPPAGTGAKALAPETAKPPATSSVNRYLIVTASFDPTGIADPSARDAAQKRAAALQKRYAPWYYVISGQSFERTRLSRRVLIKSQNRKVS